MSEGIPTYSFFQSSKKGEAEEVRLAKRVIDNIKLGRTKVIDAYHSNYFSSEDLQELGSFIDSESTLIPVPQSVPLINSNATWPSLEICKKLFDLGYGREIQPLIRRRVQVRKAAFQPTSEERPSVQEHFDSLEVDYKPMIIESLDKIVFVDDVITQGRTSYACYQKLLNKLKKDIPVSVFALVRSNNFNEINKAFYPKKGELKSFDSGKTFHSF
jgi:hypothetical protein